MPAEASLLLLGTRGPFTRAALLSLADAGVRLAGLVVPRGLPAGPAARRLPRLRHLPGGETDAVACGHAAGIPVWEVGGFEEPGALAPLLESGCDALAVACFPRRLPESWWRRPGRGAFNIHPSLLPAWRGPVPLFWQLRAAAPLGVSVHRIDAGLDTGPLVASSAQTLPDGSSSSAIESQLAARGAQLLAAALSSGAPARAQAEAGASRQGWPGPAERRVPTSWSARRAFNFLRGADRWGPFEIEAEMVRVAEALAWGEALDAPAPGARLVRFSDGALAIRPG